MSKLSKTQASTYSVQLNDMLNKTSVSWILLELSKLLKLRLDQIPQQSPAWYELVNPLNMIRSLGFILRDSERKAQVSEDDQAPN